MMRAVRVAATGLLVAALGLVAPAQAATAGPTFTVPAASLNAALTCTGDLRTGPAPILFLHGTGANSKVNWSWTWNKAMASAGRAYCNLDSPAGATGDIQIAGEYVANAIRVMHGKAGRKISMVGHSQGGMVGRWALKYWPDTRAMVDDYVSLSPSNFGAVGASASCAKRGCPAANWQQAPGSKFLSALNAGSQTWPGISYTEIVTNYDETVRPPAKSSYLPPGPNVTNVSVQSLCPLEIVEHLGMAYDNAAWLIGNDALTHPGPAKLSRVSRSTCLIPWMPSVNPVSLALGVVSALTESAKISAAAVNLKAEPALRSYAR